MTNDITIHEVYRLLQIVDAKIDKLNGSVRANTVNVARLEEKHTGHDERLGRVEGRVDEVDDRVKLFGGANALLAAIGAALAAVIGRSG